MYSGNIDINFTYLPKKIFGKLFLQNSYLKKKIIWPASHPFHSKILVNPKLEHTQSARNSSANPI